MDLNRLNLNNRAGAGCVLARLGWFEPSGVLSLDALGGLGLLGFPTGHGSSRAGIYIVPQNCVATLCCLVQMGAI